MSYKIAVASSDGIHIDESFGSAKEFRIFEVTESGYVETEIRKAVDEPSAEQGKEIIESGNTPDAVECGSALNCGKGGCHGNSGGGCANQGEISGKVELISDCRCIVCKKIGFRIQKQLERRSITSFDVSCPVEEALSKISSYFNRIDTHQSLRGISL